jgi:hypothetical protein
VGERAGTLSVTVVVVVHFFVVVVVAFVVVVVFFLFQVDDAANPRTLFPKLGSAAGLPANATARQLCVLPCGDFASCLPRDFAYVVNCDRQCDFACRVILRAV